MRKVVALKFFISPKIIASIEQESTNMDEEIEKVKSIFTDHTITNAQAQVILEVSKGDISGIEKVYKHFKNKPCDNFMGLIVRMVRPGVFVESVKHGSYENYNRNNKQEKSFYNYGNQGEYDYDYIEKKGMFQKYPLLVDILSNKRN